PDMLIGMLSDRRTEDGPRLMNAVVSRMSDGTIAKFVARNVVSESSPTDRLAQAFQTLVRNGEERERLLTLPREEVAASPLRRVAARQHRRVRRHVGSDGAEAADLLLRQAVRVRGVRP